MKKSLFDKIWESHVVEELPGGNALIFVDLVVAHEITSPQGILAIEKQFDDRLYDPERIVSLIDHVAPAKDTATAIQAQLLRSWAKRHGLKFHDIGDNGICHVIVPEKGYVTPGMTIACGDSHTGTLGAFGTFALGIGSTAQAGAMLAQVLILQRPKVMKIEVTGKLAPDTTAKDLVLTIIKTIGFKGGTGFALEYTGSAIAALSMDERMTLCNMSIEAGATSGLCAPDEKTAAYLAETTLKPTNWTALQADPDAAYDRVVTIDGNAVRPVVTWGTNPGENAPIDGAVPADAAAQSLEYMGLTAGTSMKSIAIDQAFIGSCTNARIGDLRAAAEVMRGRHVSVPTIITPGSVAVKRQAEREGLHDVFQDAGALWTHSSCGPCLGMSVGVIAPQTRVVSSTNRNFPGRMGDGGRVHLASPQVVAASAILGRIASPSDVPAAREAVTA
jgi:3-isopropylmalate/(R)-2-methylmalate dehydratase large subunit